MEAPRDGASLVQLANEILSQIHVTTRVKYVHEITPSIFVLIFEGLCGEVLQDVNRHPRTREDAIHNCQVVIDTLSMDVLNTSLSHISGEEIVAGDLTAIANLLDVFSGLLEYMLDKIGSEASSILSRARSEDFDDPDLVTPEVIDSILQSELSHESARSLSHKSQTSNRSGNSTEELIQLGHHNGIREWSVDRTSDLMALGNSSRSLSHSHSSARKDRSPNKTSPKIQGKTSNGKSTSLKSSQKSISDTRNASDSSDASCGPFSSVGVRPRDPNLFTGSQTADKQTYEVHLFHHKGREANDPLSASLPNFSSKQSTSKSLSNSYNGLENMMRQTVAMSRAAVEGSPLRPATAAEVKESEALRSSLEKISLRNSTRTSRPTSSKSRKEPKGILSPGRKPKVSLHRKAVSFKPKAKLSDTSTTDSSFNGAPINQKNQKQPDVETSNEAPQTFKDYLRKYYGNQHPRLTQKLDTSTSGHDADFSGNFDNELQEYKNQLFKKAKTVRFDDILDDSAPGRMGSLRRKLKAEDLKNRVKKQFLNQVYDEELREFEEDLWEDIAKQRLKARETNNEFRKKVLTPKSRKHRPGRKYTTPLTPKSRVRSGKKPGVLIKGRKRTPSTSPVKRQKATVTSSDDLLPWLLEEFPFLHLSSETVHDLWKKSTQQVEQMSKAERDIKHKRNKQQEQLEEAERRQKILLDIMKKEMAHTNRMRELQERRKQQQSVKSSIREKRQASARSRKYYDEFQVRMRSKMLKKRNREEMLFKKLFNEGLDIQKDRIRELRKYAKEQREKRTEIQGNDLASLENYYKDQFSLLAESMAKERKDIDVREAAQNKVLLKMKQELRQKMEKEIRDFQDQLWRDDDDIYFRDLDAERVRQELYRASYQAKV